MGEHLIVYSDSVVVPLSLAFDFEPRRLVQATVGPAVVECFAQEQWNYSPEEWYWASTAQVAYLGW